MMIFIALLSAFWFSRELKQFPERINQQVYADFIQLLPISLNEKQFIQQSQLQPKNYHIPSLVLGFICLAILFQAHSISTQLISFLLLYLAYVDFYHYLTDIRYIALIFLLSLVDVLFNDTSIIELYLFNLFYTILFFLIIIPTYQWIVKKELLGSGDICLFISLALLFSPNEMILLVLLACLLGIVFYLYHICKFRQKIDRLPFIPFVTLSTFLLFIAKLFP